MQHQHELAARAVGVGGQPGRAVARGHRRDGLELLGQLAAQRQPPLGHAAASAAGERRRCGAAPRTAPASRAACRDRVDRARALGAARRQEADEDEAARRARRRRRSARRARCSRPGSGTHAVAGGARGGDQLGARVAHRRRAGVADVGDALAARQPLEHARPRRALVVLVQRQQRLVEAEVAQQGGAVRACPRRPPRRPAPARASRAASGRRGCRSAWRRRTARPRDTAGRAAAARGGLASFDPSSADATSAHARGDDQPRRRRRSATRPKRARWRTCERAGLALVRAQLSGRARAARARRRGRPGHARRATARWCSSRCGARQRRSLRRRGGERRRRQAAAPGVRGAATSCAAAPSRRRAASTSSRSTASGSSGCAPRSMRASEDLRTGPKKPCHIIGDHARATHSAAVLRQRRPQVPAAEVARASRSPMRSARSSAASPAAARCWPAAMAARPPTRSTSPPSSSAASSASAPGWRPSR